MIVLLSPSKTQNFEQNILKKGFKIPRFLAETRELAELMKKKSASEISKLMKVSDKIAELNFARFQKWNDDFTNSSEARPAIEAFKGDVYQGLEIENWNQEIVDFAENSLRIISGFYGILTPLTLIKPYRLEMGTRLKFNRFSNLYDFWEEKLTDNLVAQNPDFIINLASVEYAKAINIAKFSEKVIDINFKVAKNNGELKTVGIYAKRQRGKMANWIAENKVSTKKDLVYYPDKDFKFAEDLSEKNNLSFIKK